MKTKTYKYKWIDYNTTMNKLFTKIKKFYGNRGVFFDFVAASLIVYLIGYFNQDVFGKIFMLKEHLASGILGFLGVLLGFLLTAFSILFVYSPNNSKTASNFRKSPAYKKILKSFLQTILFIFIVILILIIGFENGCIGIFAKIAILFIILTILRFFKCLFYLSSIICIDNSSY
ncbi:MAG: hypothetical protein ACTSWK_16825 [Promethearchaeota archaeon]